jgi:hypothetical protein
MRAYLREWHHKPFWAFATFVILCSAKQWYCNRPGPEISLGMTASEVESLLGQPTTKTQKEADDITCFYHTVWLESYFIVHYQSGKVCSFLRGSLEDYIALEWVPYATLPGLRLSD